MEQEIFRKLRSVLVTPPTLLAKLVDPSVPSTQREERLREREIM